MNRLYIFLFVLISYTNVFGQAFGIGTDIPNANAILDVFSTSKGVLIPRLTTVQRNTNLGSLTATDAGMLVYNTSDNEFNYWNGTAWISFPGANGGNDADWDNIGTVLSPSDGITKDVAVGTSTAVGKLTVENLVDDVRPGISINRNSRTANVYGLEIKSDFRNGSSIANIYDTNESFGEFRSVFNEFNGASGTTKIGVKNHFKAGSTGYMYGVQNIIETSNASSYQFFYGMENYFNSTGDVRKYGVRNYFHPNNVSTAIGMATEIYSTENNRGKSGSTVYFDEISGGNQDGSNIVINSTNTTGPTGGLRKRAYACTFGSNAGGTLTGLDVDFNTYNTGHKYGVRVNLPNSIGGIHHGINVSAGTGASDYAAYFIGKQYISYRLGIAQQVPAYSLQVGYNSAAKPSSSSWIVSSDRRLKEDIKPFTDGLNVIKQINPVWFTYNGKAAMPKETAVGTIAQELQKVAPYMVGKWEYTDSITYETTEYLDVDYGSMDFVLVNAIQEQQEMIDKLQAENSSLIQVINEISKRLSKLEEE